MEHAPPVATTSAAMAAHARAASKARSPASTSTHESALQAGREDHPVDADPARQGADHGAQRRELSQKARRLPSAQQLLQRGDETRIGRHARNCNTDGAITRACAI